MAEEGEGGLGWEDREREEQLALLREEEERLGGEQRFLSVTLIYFYLSFVFTLSPTSGG